MSPWISHAFAFQQNIILLANNFDFKNKWNQILSRSCDRGEASDHKLDSLQLSVSYSLDVADKMCNEIVGFWIGAFGHWSSESLFRIDARFRIVESLFGVCNAELALLAPNGELEWIRGRGAQMKMTQNTEPINSIIIFCSNADATARTEFSQNIVRIENIAQKNSKHILNWFEQFMKKVNLNCLKSK